MFSAGAPDFASDKRDRGQTRRVVNPSREIGSLPQLTGLPREDDKNRLGDFLSVVRVSGLPQRRRINLVEVTRNEQGKGPFGVVLRELAQQRHVIQILHLTGKCRYPTKADTLFHEGLEV
jgi:hypothetical protein